MILRTPLFSSIWPIMAGRDDRCDDCGQPYCSFNYVNDHRHQPNDRHHHNHHSRHLLKLNSIENFVDGAINRFNLSNSSSTSNDDHHCRSSICHDPRSSLLPRRPTTFTLPSRRYHSSSSCSGDCDTMTKIQFFNNNAFSSDSYMSRTKQQQQQQQLLQLFDRWSLRSPSSSSSSLNTLAACEYQCLLLPQSTNTIQTQTTRCSTLSATRSLSQLSKLGLDDDTYFSASPLADNRGSTTTTTFSSSPVQAALSNATQASPLKPLTSFSTRAYDKALEVCPSTHAANKHAARANITLVALDRHDRRCNRSTNHKNMFSRSPHTSNSCAFNIASFWSNLSSSQSTTSSTSHFFSFNHVTIMLTLVLALCSHFSPCDTHSIPEAHSAPHHRSTRVEETTYPEIMVSSTARTNETLPAWAYIKPTTPPPDVRSFAFRQLVHPSSINRQIRQPPPINHHDNFCGEPPLVANAQSNLQRNQKHHVFPLGQIATYMCEQGFQPETPIGNDQTRCIFVDPQRDAGLALQAASHVIFPDSSKTFPDPDHVILLGSGRSKNSKRLISDLDEEPDLNVNGQRSVGANHLLHFPGNYDKRKAGRKTEDDLIGSMYDSTAAGGLDGRHSDLENDSVEYLERRKQKMEKNIRASGPRWWPPITLNCKRVICPDPGHVENAKRMDSNLTLDGQFTLNSNVFFKCDEGYEPMGIPILTCRANGAWNRMLPQCRVKKCPELPALEHGRIEYNDNRNADSRAEYYCADGFKLNSILNIRHCRQDLNWTEFEPLPGANITDPYRCLAVECPVPRKTPGLRIMRINNRRKSWRKFVPEDVILYDCLAIKHTVTAKCRPDGEWTREAPICPELKTNCPPLPLFPNGEYTLSDSRVNFSCYDGYNLTGSSTITCLQKGVWSAPVPKCHITNSKFLPSTSVGGADGKSGLSASSESDEDHPNASDLANLDEQQRNTSNTLTVLLIIIGLLLLAVGSIGGWYLCRNRRDKQQRKRWQKYFGHYHHRQSKTNIVMNVTNNHYLSSGANGLSAAANVSAASAAGGGIAGISASASSSSSSGNANFAATRHLLEHQRPRKTAISSGTRTGNILQSSFSSSSDNDHEIKSYTGTGTISSDHARTVSSYADDTCPEDEDDDEEEDAQATVDEDLYSNASILQQKLALSPESTPMMLLSPVTTTTTSGNTLPLTDHIYSNVPRPASTTNTSSSFPLPLFSPSNQTKSNVPVTEL